MNNDNETLMTEKDYLQFKMEAKVNEIQINLKTIEILQ